MKTLVLMGSPRKKGNTARVLGWIKDELALQGHEVESVYLNGKNIKGCLSCANCKEKAEFMACVQTDDAPEILQKMAQAQLLIFASPLYFWGFSAQIKSLIDRTYSLYKNYHQPDHSSMIEGKKTALLVTGGGPFKNNAEPVFSAFDRMQKPWKTKKAGELYIGPCSTPDKLGDDVAEKARVFARLIAQ